MAAAKSLTGHPPPTRLVGEVSLRTKGQAVKSLARRGVKGSLLCRILYNKVLAKLDFIYTVLNCNIIGEPARDTHFDFVYTEWLFAWHSI